MSIITARFAGTCTKTGTRYPAGTLIQRGAKGWEICESALSQGGPAAAPPIQPDHRAGYASSSRPGSSVGVSCFDDRHDGRPYHDPPTDYRRSNRYGDGGEPDGYDHADANDWGHEEALFGDC